MSLHLTTVVSTTTSELTIASGAITITGLHHTVAAESGITDDLTNITINSTLSDALNGRPFFVILHAAQGDTITVVDSTAADGVYTFCGANLTMTENEPVLLFYNPGTNEGWAGFGTPAGNIVTETGTQTLTNKTLTAPALNSPVIKLGEVNFSSGAISSKTGFAYLTGGSPTTYTLANPTNGTDDGKELTIYSTTAHAHKIDYSAGAGFDGGGASLDFANFGGAIGDNIVIFAKAGVWCVKSTRNVTIAAS